MAMARKKKGAGKDNADRWLLTYADLITLLMVFFVMLFAMSTTDAKKFQELAGSLRRAFNVNVLQGSQPVALAPSNGGGDAVIQLEQQNYQRIQQIIRQVEQQTQVSPQQISAQITQEGIAVTVSGALLFYNGTNQIKPDGITLLQQIGGYIATLPNPVRVEGHTDDIPVGNAQYPTNWELSAARAVAVVRFFTDVMDITPQRLSAVGYGQYHPIVPNDTRAHREQNRRAVIVILYGQAAAAVATATPGP
jgi:chemotaxis protein MotB